MMTLKNMRENGTRYITIHCTVECGHHVEICVDGWDEAIEVPLIAQRYACSRCGNKKPTSRPAWHMADNPPFGTPGHKPAR